MASPVRRASRESGVGRTCFSGRPLSPPESHCLSQSHQASKLWSTLPRALPIDSAPTHVKTCRWLTSPQGRRGHGVSGRLWVNLAFTVAVRNWGWDLGLNQGLGLRCPWLFGSGLVAAEANVLMIIEASTRFLHHLPRLTSSGLPSMPPRSR